MKYYIPFIPPSLNKFAGRNNAWEYREEKNKWKDLCQIYCRPKPKVPIEKSEVIITFFFGNKCRHDADNYQKMLLDGLVSAGIIQDDDFEHITVTCKGKYDKENPRTKIEIKEV